MVFTVALLIALTHSGPRGLLSASQGIPPTHCCSWGGMEGQRGSVPQGTGVCQDQCPRTQYQAPMCTHGTEKASGMAGPSSGQPLEFLPKSPLLGFTPWPPQRDPQHQMFICGLPGARHWAKCLLSVDSFYPHRDPTEQRSKQRFPESNNPPKSHSACVDEAQAPD